MHKGGVDAFYAEQRKRIHALTILNREEFVYLLQSKVTQSDQVQPIPSLFLSSPENVFPSLKQTKLLLTYDTVYHVFDPPSASRALSEKMITGSARASISKRISSNEEFPQTLLLDWLTIVMAQARRKFFTEYTLPRTLYIRPRATWPRAGTDKTRPVIEETQSNFSRIFQWHIVNSSVFKSIRRHDIPGDEFTPVEEGKGEIPLKALLAVVTTWTSATSPPTSWGFWTYIRNDGVPQPFTNGSDQYNQEKQAMMLKTRLRSFDPHGIYEANHFTVSVETYNHLTLGQFIALMCSAEFHHSHYSPLVLDHYVTRHIKTMFPTTDTRSERDHSDVIQTILFGAVPPVNVSIIGNEESIYAFPVLGDISMFSPYSYGITPVDISFETNEFSELVDIPDLRGHMKTFIIDETYRKEELDELNIVLLKTQSTKELRTNYPDDAFFIKTRPNMKTARDEAIFIKKAHMESSHIPDIAGVSGRRLILQRVGVPIQDYPFRGGFQEWISNEENKEVFLLDITEALTALWIQGFIHGDLGTDRPPEKVTRLLGDKAANRNITYDGEHYYVIDLDLENMIPKNTSPRYSIPELSQVNYDSDDYPRKQAEEIYEILTS